MSDRSTSGTERVKIVDESRDSLDPGRSCELQGGQNVSGDEAAWVRELIDTAFDRLQTASKLLPCFESAYDIPTNNDHSMCNGLREAAICGNDE